MSTLTLDQVIADFGHLPALPEVVMQLMDYLQGDDIDAAQVEHMLSKDQALVARSLLIANSTFYGLPRKVASIHDAIVILGLRPLHTLVTAAAMSALFHSLQQNLSEAGYHQNEFWLHAIGTAFCARALAQQTHANPEHAFTAGLLHDIGCLVEAARFPKEYAAVVQHHRQHDCHLIDAERNIHGFAHPQIGAALAEHWRFAPTIRDAIAWHHAPEEHTADSLAGIVHLADIMAHTLNLDRQPRPLVPPLSPVVWNRLGLTWSDFKQLLADTDRQFQNAELLIH